MPPADVNIALRYLKLPIMGIAWSWSLTSELTDRRRNRALAANTALDQPGSLDSNQGAAVRVKRFVRLYRVHIYIKSHFFNVSSSTPAQYFRIRMAVLCLALASI